MTTQSCDEWLARLRSDDYFIAFRMPMATAAPTMSYGLPFVFVTPYSQTLSLQETGVVTPLLTVPMEYRLGRLHFLANALPSAEGEHWASLGLSSTGPASCPEGLDLAVGEWHVLADLLIDLHDQPDDCEGCVLRYYYCYEGQASPWPSGATAAALARGMGVETYQDDGITCLGPKTLAVPPASGLYLSGSESVSITPTQRIELHEHLRNWTGGPVTVTLDLASTVEGWQMYDGDAEAPDLEKPILAGSPISIETWQQHIWLVNDVPEDTPDGPHSLVLTATVPTAPAQSTFDSIPIWCGDWVAPPFCEPITSLSPDGPTTTTVDAATTFTAIVGPPTATLPITFTWWATEQMPVVHESRNSISDTVDFTWEITGTQDITVTAVNGCSEFVSAPRHVQVEDAPEEKRIIYLPLVLRNEG
jgi:hypothetical protein